MLSWWSVQPKEFDQESLVEEGQNRDLEKAESLIMKEPQRNWKFVVKAITLPGEYVCVVGNCTNLGNWKHSGVFQLSKDTCNSDENVWSGVVTIPDEQNVEFRYCVCIVLDSDSEKACPSVVRRWETHITPRVICKEAASNVGENMVPEIDIFGYHDQYTKVERGWLTSESVIQFKLYNDPVQLWKRKLEGKKVYVKVSPVNLTRRKNLENVPFVDVVDDSMDTQDVPDQPDKWPITEISVMNEEESEFCLQEQFGRAYTFNDVIIFNVSVLHPEAVAYLVDFYVYSTRCTPNEPPFHVGFSYILPSILKKSEGQAIVPITSVKHRPIGQLTVDYTVIQPIVGFECDMSMSYAQVWKPSWEGLDVGHRGLGTSFKGSIEECADVRENTIESLKRAAMSGADLVEFDVQLSKDLVPVLYHDFHVCIAMKHKKDLWEHDTLQLPLKDLTLDQLHMLKGIPAQCGLSKVLHFCDSERSVMCCGVYHVAEKVKVSSPHFVDEELEEHQPFPTLQQALEVLDPHVGFNIEIKWNMQLQDGTFELYHPFELNMYLDTVLKVVLQHAGTRKIVFSCFHPDICTMIRLKQNKYPVLFLTQGVTQKYPKYLDPRSQTIPMAIYFAKSAGILGVNAHTEDILRDSSQVKLVRDAGLVIFCWGEDNNDTNTIQYLKKLGLHGVIYDKIDKYSSKEVKESIFLVEAREAKKELRQVAYNPSVPASMSPLPSSSDYVLNFGTAREPFPSGSTASMLSLFVPGSSSGVTLCGDPDADHL